MDLALLTKTSMMKVKITKGKSTKRNAIQVYKMMKTRQ
jgi:hypothetical protein